MRSNHKHSKTKKKWVWSLDLQCPTSGCHRASIVDETDFVCVGCVGFTENRLTFEVELRVRIRAFTSIVAIEITTICAENVLQLFSLEICFVIASFYLFFSFCYLICHIKFSRIVSIVFFFFLLCAFAFVVLWPASERVSMNFAGYVIYLRFGYDVPCANSIANCILCT